MEQAPWCSGGGENDYIPDHINFYPVALEAELSHSTHAYNKALIYYAGYLRIGRM